LLNNFAEMMRIKVSEKGLRFTWSISPETPVFLLGDPNRLQQVLINLVGNAIKFTSSGEIKISVHLDSETKTAARILFSISDTGIGIPEDKISIIFDKFSQVDTSTTRQFGGTGLGLAISKRLVQAMHGKIGVKSIEGSGSEFWFTAFFAKQGDQESKTDVQQDLTKLPAIKDKIPASIKILLVEDNIINQKVAKGFLKKLGFSIDIASNGLEAIKLLKVIPYDLVLMDCQMPVMNGYETSLEIRNPQSKVLDHDIIIIAMTANAMKEDRQKCLDAGMNDYIPKPIKVSLLESMLKKWLNVKIKHTSEQKMATEKPSKKAPIIFNPKEMIARLEDIELAKVIIETSLTDIPYNIELLKEGLLAENSSDVRRILHTIKSVSAALSGEELSKLAAEMEILAAKEKIESVKEYIPTLETSFEYLKLALKDFIDSN